MNTRKRTKSTAEKIQSPRISQDDSADLLDDSSTGKSKTGKSRAKNYSAEESAALIKVCDKYHAIISANSHTDKDKQEKQDAWEKIKSEFDEYCESQGIPTFDRKIDSLQSKYKELKKLARKELSEAKRDLLQTGNKPLRSRTIETLRETNVLLQLRQRMGPSATGFKTKHCSDATQRSILERLQDEIEGNQSNRRDKNAPSTSTYVPGSIRTRTQAVYKGSIDSSTLRFGVESDNCDDFSADEDEDYEASNCSSNSSKEKANRSRKSIPRKLTRTDSTSNHSLQRNFGSLHMSSPTSSSFANVDFPPISPITTGRNEFDGNLDDELESEQQITSMENRQESNTQTNEPTESDLTPSQSLPLQREQIETFQDNDMNLMDDTNRNEIVIDQDMPSEEETMTADLNRRLVAPRDEIRSRRRQPRSLNQSKTNDDHIKELRERQLELVKLQVDCQKVLLENAKITQKKCIEELLYAQKLRSNLNQ